MNADTQKELASLFAEAGQAHHKAFEATDGHDPDWPTWYVDFLAEPLARRFNLQFTHSQLVYCLMRADMEHQARAPESNWQKFYAREIVEHCVPSNSADRDALALYYIDGCPFCDLVRREIDRLGLDVELRNVFSANEHRDALVKERGRATVPVLRISSPDGEERWMPESRDIVSYLQKTYGRREG